MIETPPIIIVHPPNDFSPKPGYHFTVILYVAGPLLP
jgi:hypothetical protein